MPISILMPALSPTMTEGNLAKWLKKEGDTIKPGEVIAEIETDKATMEVEAVDGGKLAKILVPENSQGVKVNQLIAVIAQKEDDTKAIDAFIAKQGSDGAAASSAASEDKSTPQIMKAANDGAHAAAVASESAKVFATPLAKKIAKQENVDLSRVSGSGPRGRIIRDDVLKSVQSGAAKQVAYTAASLGRDASEYQNIPHSQMRRVIAKRLSESKATVPHFYLNAEADVSELLKARELINSRAKGSEYKISINDFVVKAAAAALRKFSRVNASWTEEGMLMYNNVDISIAVSIEDGLITPIVQNADQKGLIAISQEVKSLAERAKQNQLRPEEFQGGGFTISNLGMYGVKSFQAIINPPQSAILAVGGVEERPVIRAGKVEAARVLNLSLSCDHRVVDGVLAAEFMAYLVLCLENPALLSA